MPDDALLLVIGTGNQHGKIKRISRSKEHVNMLIVGESHACHSGYDGEDFLESWGLGHEICR